MTCSVCYSSGIKQPNKLIFCFITQDLYFKKKGSIQIENTIVKHTSERLQNGVKINNLVFSTERVICIFSFNFLFFILISNDKNSNDLNVTFIDASQSWPIKKKLPNNIFEFNTMINTFILEMFPKSADLESKPLVLVHSE